MTSARATLLHYLAARKIQLMLGVAAATGAAFAAVIPPHFIGQIIDTLQTPGAKPEVVVRLALFIVAASAADATLRAAGRFLILNSARKSEYAIRNDLFAHLQKMDVAYFQHQRVGDLMARMINDLNAVVRMMGMGIMQSATTLMIFTFTLISMLGVSVKFTLIALLLLPMASFTFAYVGRKVHHRFELLQAKFADLAAKAQENLSGIRVVKAFSQEGAEVREFGRVNKEYVARALSLVAMQGVVWPAMSFILGLTVLAVLYLGGADAIKGELTLGQLIQFIAYLQLLSMPMVNVGMISNLVQSGWASLGRLQELFDAKPTVGDPDSPVAARIRGEVEFRSVGFGYGRTPVLEDISFRVAAGGSLAIVGHTGAGKSSLVNLIPRLFDPQRGEVLVDGVDVRRYTLADLRRAIGYVPQETFLFSVPLRDNVGFGTDEPLTDAQLDWAGEVSQLSKDVDDFPARYDTMIGERGVTLSGGQKQRAAIARAVAKDPRILILDDALSAVDTYTESEILRRLRGVMRERTSIVVAHRISTVKDADEILVLDDGRIAERGTHQELLQRDGLYARMYRRQLLEQELEVDEEQDEHERRVSTEPAADAPTLRPRSDLGGVPPEGA